MPNIPSFALALALSLLANVPSAFACKCAQRAVAESVTEASAVFEGRVTQIEKILEEGATEAQKIRVTLALVRVWKSLESTESVTVTTNSEPAACGFHFEQGHSYLVYASGEGESEGLRVNSCSRTRPMADAAEDLAALGGGVTPVKVQNATSPATGHAPDGPVATQAREATPEAESEGTGATGQRGCALGTNGDSGAGARLCALLVGLLLARRRWA